MRYLFRTNKYYHLYFSSSGQDNILAIFFVFSGHTPGNKNGAYRPDTPIYLQKNKKNRAGTRGGRYGQCICKQNYRRV